jgi:cytidine deaminase
MADFSVLEYFDLPAEDQHLIAEAIKATQFSYAPYSSFYVGTALLLEDSKVIFGANQENASYPLCICSERVALYSKSMQYPEKNILKMAVTARKGEQIVPATCCGACRQVMVEYEKRQNSAFEVIMQISPQKWLKSKSADDLIPFQFEF